jgi:hypothetical protein
MKEGRANGQGRENPDSGPKDLPPHGWTDSVLTAAWDMK